MKVKNEELRVKNPLVSPSFPVLSVFPVLPIK